MFSLTNFAIAEVGEITEFRGSGLIERSTNKLDANLQIPIEMNDYVQTAKGIVGITFEDETKVRISEHSELIIDDFIYDPNTSSGALGLKINLGTVKYASGLIAHNNPDTVNIETPSASIAVRGTAFSMTVDEVGGSLVILLPNIDGSVGEISVISDIGSVILNKAFEATAVPAKERLPTKPVILAINESLIDNLLIIAPPKEIKQKLVAENQENPLTVDLLKFEDLTITELDKDELAFDDLSINELSTDLLGNLLMSSFEEANDGRVSGFNEASGVYTFIEDSIGRIVRFGNNTYIDVLYSVQNGVTATIIQTDTEVLVNSIDPESANKIRIFQQ